MIKAGKLGEPGIFGISVLIPNGMRIVSIPVSASDSMSGLLQPNDRVDLTVTYKLQVFDVEGRQHDQTKNKTLLEYVKVFAVDNRTATDGGDEAAGGQIKNLQLIVTPEQFAWVKLAQSKGQLSVAWRSELDSEMADVATLDEGLLEELQGAVGATASLSAPDGEGDVPAYDRSDASDVASRDEEPEDVEPVDFRKLLQEAAADDFADAASAAPEPSMWAIQFGVGDRAQTVEVPMPESEELEAEGEVPPLFEGLEPDGTETAVTPTVETATRVARKLLLGF